ncbi:MAG: hypothetical protein IH609_15010 [Dehalococcoidia bacterium]|nr:hypothetical protein [Dehalococcoidia bacterium]
MRRVLQVGAVAALVTLLAVSVVLALPGDDRQGGSAPPLTSPQDVTAESGGVTLAVSGAEFSGSATFVELAARVAGADPNKVTRVSIPAKAFVSGNLAPADLTSIMLIANGRATIQRLRPVSAVGPVKMVVSFVDVDDGQGTRRIAGDWVLEFKPPADLARALRVETLSPGAPAEAQGVTVRPLSSTRSTTETLVTVALEGPPGIEQLALPSLVGASVNGGPVFGPRIAGGAGEPVTFSFPPTDFGTPLEIQFTEFIASPAPGESSARWVDIRLDSVLSRQGVTGKRGERAAVDSSDIVAASGGDPLGVTGLWFSDPSVRQIAFTMTGYFPDPNGFSLTLADGTIVPPAGSGTETGTSPTGDVGQGASSFVSFAFSDFDQLLGTVRLTFGEPGSILRDRWKVGFTP